MTRPAPIERAAVGDDPGASAFVALDESASPTGTTFECGLCGTRFTHGGQVCGACPLHAGCDLVRCPNCGFQFPRSSRLAEWGRRLWRRVAGGRGR